MLQLSVSLCLKCVLVVIGYCGRRNIKVPSVKTPELTNVFPEKHGVGQNRAKYAKSVPEFLPCPNFRSPPGPFTLIFSKSSPYFSIALVLAEANSLVTLRNKIGHTAHSQLI